MILKKKVEVRCTVLFTSIGYVEYKVKVKSVLKTADILVIIVILSCDSRSSGFNRSLHAFFW